MLDQAAHVEYLLRQARFQGDLLCELAQAALDGRKPNRLPLKLAMTGIKSLEDDLFEKHYSEEALEECTVDGERAPPRPAELDEGPQREEEVRGTPDYRRAELEREWERRKRLRTADFYMQLVLQKGDSLSLSIDHRVENFRKLLEGGELP